MPEIHPTAIVDSNAELAADCIIGPWCTVGPDVKIGAGTRLISHAVIDGFTEIGAGCTVFPFACLGMQTQDLKFKGGRPGVKIGDGCTFREYSTVNAATFDGDFTTVGNRCHIMAYCHIAHDCHVADEVIMANAATLAGHVIVEEQAIIGGLVGVHQFVKVGCLSITGGCSKIVQDVPPFMMADGNPLEIRGVNKIGMERHQYTEEEARMAREAYRILYRKSLSTRQAIEEIDRELDSANRVVTRIRAFIDQSQRGITK